MFEKNTRVWIALGGGVTPGVCVDDPAPDSYLNRRGVTVRTQRVPVISLRSLPGRPSWYQLSYEATTLLSPRETIEQGLDVLGDGTPMPLPTLWGHQRESLQAYLAKRQAQRPVAATSQEDPVLIEA